MRNFGEWAGELLARLERNAGHGIVIVLTLAAMFRLGGWVGSCDREITRCWTPDSSSYHQSAHALLEIGEFAVAPDRPGVPQTVRTPGYPVLLAGVYALVGNRPDVAVVVQVLLSLGTIALVYWIGSALWRPAVGLIAAFLLAVDGTSLSYALLVRTESTFTVALLLFVAAVVRYLATWRRRWLLMASVALAASAFIRPISYYLVVPVALGLLYLVLREGRGARAAGLALVTFVVPFAMLVGAWQYRNERLTGNASFSNISAYNVLFYRAAGVIALRDDIRVTEARDRLYAEFPISYEDAPAHAERMTEAGVKVIRTYPLLYASTIWRGAVRMMLGPGTESFAQLFGASVALALAALSLLHLGLIYLLTAIWVAFRRFSRIDLMLWGLIAYFVVVSAGPEAYSRFRVPLMPLLALYAAAGAVALIARFAGPGRGARAAPDGSLQRSAS